MSDWASKLAMDSATFDALGLSTPFEDKTGGQGRNASGSGFLNINDDSELSPERAAVRNGPSDVEKAKEQRLYPLPPEATRQLGVPAGEIREYMRWAQSTVYPDTERDFWVYVPANCDDRDTSSSLLVVQDGKSYLQPDGLVRTATILDNMIASGALPPTVAVFLEPGRRLHPPAGDPSVGADGAGDIVDDAQRSLESDTVSERCLLQLTAAILIRHTDSTHIQNTDCDCVVRRSYGRFLLEDILPFVQQFAPNITTDPRRRALMGVSSGCVHHRLAFAMPLRPCTSEWYSFVLCALCCVFRAIAAFAAAWFHPSAFGGVISHCG